MEIKKAFLNTSFLGFVDCSFRSMFRSWPSYVEPHHRLLQISCRTIVPSFKYRNAVLYVYQFNNLVLLFVTTTYEMIFATPCNGVCRAEDIVITDLMCSHIHLWVIIDLQLWIGEENTSLDHFNSKVYKLTIFLLPY